MKFLITIYQWLIGGTLFLLFLIISFLLTFILPLKVMDPFVKWMLRSIISLLFIKVEIEGTQYLDNNKRYLFLPNHVSFLDIPLFGGHIPSFLRGVEAMQQHQWPIYGWAMKRLGNIPIDRSSARASMKSLDKAAEYLQSKCSVILFPEGGRTADGQLRPFKKLPFRMAKQAKVEIVPIAMNGMFEINNKNKMTINPGKIKLSFGKPIPVETVEELDAGELKELVRKQLLELLSNH